MVDRLQLHRHDDSRAKNSRGRRQSTQTKAICCGKPQLDLETCKWMQSCRECSWADLSSEGDGRGQGRCECASCGVTLLAGGIADVDGLRAGTAA